MDSISTKLIVTFEDPFWVGVFERTEGRMLSVCKITFGAEPKDYDVWDFILKHYSQLKFSPTVDAAIRKEAANPKRAQRLIQKQIIRTGIGTKSQQALQLQHEAMKLERKTKTREVQEAEKQQQFVLRQQKRKEKHRGR